jgi:hypothetical protein
VIVLVVVILGIGFIIFILRMNRYSKRPEYLKGKKVDKYTDLITQKEVYIATSKDPVTKQFIHEAYYTENGDVCKQALYRQAYGIVYFGEGRLRMVPRSVAEKYLRAVREGKSPVLDLGKIQKTNERKN